MTKLYRPCVGIALFNQEGKVFVGKRMDMENAWQMPQGGIDEGEDIKTAFYREMKEEIGTDKADILEILDTPLRYDFPNTLRHNFFDSLYAGQEQTWVAGRFTGENSDINIKAFDPPEFSEWTWKSLETILDLIVPFKKEIYKDVIKVFTRYS